jgi:putative hydrolase of the HAD superfamily
MPTRAVLFDFHQTLFRFEGDEQWIDAAARRCRLTMVPADRRAIARRLDEARSWPEVLELGAGRDLSSAAHRAFILAWLRLVGTPSALAQALYARLVTPLCWLPYPDTGPVLRSLAEHAVPVAVVSNTGWDLRETFAHHGLARYVRAYALSCEHGAEKPGSDLFLAACTELGVRPAEAVMIGDNPITDGGSITAGIPAYLVSHECGDGPRGLDAVLRLAGVATPDPRDLNGAGQGVGDTKPTR